MNQLQTPILFLVFNRPDTTSRVFEAIRTVRPTQLFVAADGARPHVAGEETVCQQTRSIATNIDWPCTVHTLFRNENVGCGRAVSGAITWFFEHVEEGIILEDDCLPHPDFFPYCTTLLARYREEPTIATIGGTHFLPAELSHQRSHYVSKYFQMWGWATWRRTWARYDFGLTSATDAQWEQLFKDRHPISVESGYWTEILRSFRAGNIDTWDFQVFFTCWRDHTNHIMPGRNLVSNLGFGPGATHTAFESPMANLAVQPLVVGDHETVPLTPDPVLDNIIFYLRFLESMTHTWWADQVLAPDRKLGEARTEMQRLSRENRILERVCSTLNSQLNSTRTEPSPTFPRTALARLRSLFSTKKSSATQRTIPAVNSPEANP